MYVYDFSFSHADTNYIFCIEPIVWIVGGLTWTKQPQNLTKQSGHDNNYFEERGLFLFIGFFDRSITNYVFLLSDFKSRDDPNMKMNLLSKWVGKSMHVDNTPKNCFVFTPHIITDSSWMESNENLRLLKSMFEFSLSCLTLNVDSQLSAHN